jgi:hypothetical protein
MWEAEEESLLVPWSWRPASATQQQPVSKIINNNNSFLTRLGAPDALVIFTSPVTKGGPDKY